MDKGLLGLAFCGAYCRSCIFFNRSISVMAELLENLILHVNLEEWYKPLRFKWKEAKEFLKEMKEGKFNCKSCKVEPNWKECPVYLCATQKRVEGCWMCTEFPCKKLRDVWKKHPEYLEEFVKVVRENGVEEWVKIKEKQYKKGEDFLGRKVYQPRSQYNIQT